MDSLICDLLFENNKELFLNLDKKCILLTGATGVIGSRMLEILDYFNKTKNLNTKIICPTRDPRSAKERFRKVSNAVFIDNNSLKENDELGCCDYIVHLASPTRSKDFVSKPVEVIDYMLDSMRDLLELARKKNVKKIVYVSSTEVYGDIKSNDISEDEYGLVNTMNVRSCYPEAKRLCENLCVAYNREYQVNVSIARLTQILAASSTDNRIISTMVKNAIEKTPIVLKTDGLTKKNYCNVYDAIVALFYVLFGNELVYNIANRNIVNTIKQLAEYISQKYIGKEVVFNIENKGIYPANSTLVLNTDRILATGWKPLFGLDESIKQLIREYK